MDDDKTDQNKPNEQNDPWGDPAVQERLHRIYSRNVGYRIWPGQIEVKEHMANRIRHNPRTFMLLVAFSVAVLAIGYALAAR